MARATCLAVFALALLCTVAAHAQDIFGRVSGTITDPTGAVIPDAKVTIINEATKVPRQISTDKNGYYVADDLPVGTYSVAAEQTGFTTTKQTGNVLVAGEHLTVDLSLKVGGVSQEVTVSAVGVPVNTVSGEM